MRGMGATVRAHKTAWVIVTVLIFVALAAAVGVSGCGAAEESVTTTAAASMTTAAPAAGFGDGRGEEGWTPGQTADQDSSGSATPSEGRSDTGGGGALAALEGSLGQKVISDAQLEIEVESGRFQAVFDQALLLADRYGGYLVSSGSYAGKEETGLRSGTIALRVPADSFARALADAGTLGEVKSRRVETQDVTEEYVDLQARIANSQAHVQALLNLLAKAKTVDEILQVQQVLTYAQQELEQLRGRLRYLDEHTSYSTLTLTIFESGAALTAATEEWGFTQALKDAVRNLVRAVNAIVRGLGILVPVVVVLAIIALIVYLIWRATARRRTQRETRGYQRYPQGWHGQGPGMTPPVSTATTAAGPAATATADQTTADQALTGETTPPATRGDA